MNTITVNHAAAKESSEWKTEDYHGKQMHVCTQLRPCENQELSGHGSQWTFVVKITENGVGSTDDKGLDARSDPELFYTTQAIAEDMGFLRGRELIEAA